MKLQSLLPTLLKWIPAIIFLQTLFYKFSAAPESVYIFSTLGLEPYGRIGLGILELIVAILLIVPRTTWIGALLGLGIMAGALFAHMAQLGIVVQNDGGTLFVLALIAFICCLLLVWMHRKQIPFVKFKM